MAGRSGHPVLIKRRRSEPRRPRPWMPVSRGMPAMTREASDGRQTLASRNAVRRPRLPHELTRSRRCCTRQQTEHQHLVLFEHKHFGKMLMLDGATQVTTRDEFIYHEMMTHVPILAHGKATQRADHRRRRLRHRRGGAQAQGAEERRAGRDRRVGGRVLQGAFPGIHHAGVPRQALRERDRTTA